MSPSSVPCPATAPAVAPPAGQMLEAEELLWPAGLVLACPAVPVAARALSSAGSVGPVGSAGSVGPVAVEGAVRLLDEGSGSRLRARAARTVARTAARADRAGEPAGTKGSGGVAVVVAAHEARQPPVAEAAVDSRARSTGPRTLLPAFPRSFCAGVAGVISVAEALREQRARGGRRVAVGTGAP
ncbi:hypothetical protein ABZX40_12505 [Streptomyces sp. NPDC004610]|uniref:hypothetical protein n=1 Tax=unclassified Streptomyces TaxID=2593676 RepID=UPI0033BF4FBD